MIFDQNHSLQLPVGWMSIKNEWFIGIPPSGIVKEYQQPKYNNIYQENQDNFKTIKCSIYIIFAQTISV